ncbi:hypothetical protein AX16_008761 [Volvariella volvacea WC 439]|nr:hypothetical protein AX16_008761 [Volvariella volvacea WC 439]
MGGLMVQIERQRFEVVHWKHDGHRGPGLYAWSGAFVERIPAIRKKEIVDRGKGDWLAKAIITLQTSWFVAQCIARNIEGLALAELEFVTLAFAVLNAFTYGLWWEKPLNVEYPIYFNWQGNRVNGPEEGEGLHHNEASPVPSSSSDDRDSMFNGVTPSDGMEGSGGTMEVTQSDRTGPFSATFGPLLDMANREIDADCLPTSVHPYFAATLGASQHKMGYFFSSAVGVSFGGIHLLGWNLQFPNIFYLWLWRSSSLMLVFVPALITISWPFGVEWWRSPRHDDPIICRILWFLVIRIGSSLYILSRFVIILLVYVNLRNLPESAYKNVNWTNFIPHF